MFHVVCIDDASVADIDGRNSIRPLGAGLVYTVVGETNEYGWWKGVWMECQLFILAEVRNPYAESGFNKARFRPLSSTRLDVFRQLLVSPKERVGA